VRFVQLQAPRLHPKRAKLLTSALRSFLQYARYLGKAKLDLAAAVPVVATVSPDGRIALTEGERG
jgi:integrase/recombinase XerD